jgi:hypothetical protein
VTFTERPANEDLCFAMDQRADCAPVSVFGGKFLSPPARRTGEPLAACEAVIGTRTAFIEEGGISDTYQDSDEIESRNLVELSTSWFCAQETGRRSGVGVVRNMTRMQIVDTSMSSL